jgi:uncharacterized repeat protein (TIGR03803 family)
VVFKLGAAGKETTLHTFTGGADGSYPMAPVIRDWAGNLYGTTILGGGSNSGVVFKLDRTSKETVLYSFTGGTDGGQPYGGLTLDAAGDLYGTTAGGGLSCSVGSGCGVVFKLDRRGKETTLHSFTGEEDGVFPFAGLLLDAAGNLYGTTANGGDLNCNAGVGCGVVFKLDPSGKETTLYSFTGGADGAYPMVPVIQDRWGNLYGTATRAGDLTGTCANVDGCGVVFKLTSHWP